MAAPRKLDRRTFIKRAFAAGALVAAGGAGYRQIANLRGRQYDVDRGEDQLSRIAPGDEQQGMPNIVLILADDLGCGDLGCYGSQAIETPNLDGMAAQGVRLTQFNSAASLCSPSRAALLTGRYPIRSHVTMPFYPAGSPMDLIFRAGGVYTYGVRGIPPDEILLPEILKHRGYRTALMGKWHLGDRSPHLPNENGFDYFYGAYHSNNHRPYAIYCNAEVAIPAPADQNMLTQQLTREAVRFIRDNASQPFFLYYAQPFPHIPLHASPPFRGRSKAGLYGDVVGEVDWSVGQILETLHELGLDRNTLILFASDNGPWWQGSARPTRGRKNLPFEGGHRVPMIARWPGVLPAGTVSDELCSTLDLFGTCLAAAGLALPADRIIDGYDILPLLQGHTPSPHSALYYYKGRRLIGVRQGKWKYMRRHMTDNGGYASLKQGPFLFNLETDPNESYSLIESEPEVARRLVEVLETWETEMARNVRGWL